MLSQSSPPAEAGIIRCRNPLTQVAIDGHVQQDYIYYGVGVPWLQVSLLRMLQYYPPSGLSSTVFVNM
jgi:AP-2 complex subunit alpha